MKFENLPEYVQHHAAEALKLVLVNYAAEDKEKSLMAAGNIKSAFVSLFDDRKETEREVDIAALIGIIADNPRLTVNEALDVFKARDKNLERVSKLTSALAQEHGA